MNGLRALLQPLKAFFDEKLPHGVGWPNTLGSALLALVMVQITTGILLALYYSPNAEVAWDSVRYIEEQVLFGAVIRGIHHFAASAFVIVLFLHMIRTFYHAAYKPPRQWNWISGVLLFLVVLGFAFTGYLLPWDMKAYFATKVGINVGGTVPLLGPYIVKLMQGGSEMSTITLTRFYALHVIVLPLVLLCLVGVHLVLIRLHGPTPPGRKEGEPVAYGHRFFPKQLLLDSVTAFFVVGAVVYLAVTAGAPLEPKADPTDTAYVPRPDWYFYGLFQLLKLFAGKWEFVGAAVIPGLFFTLLILLPFLDKNPERAARRRPLAMLAGSGIVLLVVFLTLWGGLEAARDRRAFTARMEKAATGQATEQKEYDPDAGSELFEALRCAACHLLPSQAENIPPGIEFSGNKYRESWLIRYLQAPYRIRWIRKNERPIVRMPDFALSPTEAGHLAAYLMTYRMDSKFPPVDFAWSEADSEMVEAGRELYEELGCNSCHTIQGAGGNIGPDLTHVGSKLQETYLYHLIKSPGRIIPDTPMKDFQLEEDEVLDLVAYLRTLR